MLRLQSVSKTYAKNNVKAVNNISLDVAEGSVFGFLGPNGAGKTTAIKMITGILPFEEGHISVYGKDIIESPLEAKREIGYVNDSGVLFEKLSGREFVDFMADIYGVSLAERKSRTDIMLEMFNLTSAYDQQISTYSHGMKQKISLIGALVHEPRLLILDEPMVGLDPQSAFQLKEIIKRHAEKGNIVFFSTHVLDVAEKMCDQIGIISKGSLILSGSLDEIKKASNDKSLEDIFLSVAGSHTGIL